MCDEGVGCGFFQKIRRFSIIFESQVKVDGRPLAESERAYFEPRFGYDYSQVRLHSDAQAATDE